MASVTFRLPKSVPLNWALKTLTDYRPKSEDDEAALRSMHEVFDSIERDTKFLDDKVTKDRLWDEVDAWIQAVFDEASGIPRSHVFWQVVYRKAYAWIKDALKEQFVREAIDEGRVCGPIKIDGISVRGVQSVDMDYLTPGVVNYLESDERVAYDSAGKPYRWKVRKAK